MNSSAYGSTACQIFQEDRRLSKKPAQLLECHTSLFCRMPSYWSPHYKLKAGQVDTPDSLAKTIGSHLLKAILSQGVSPQKCPSFH